MTILEAMSCGIPVVAFHNYGPDEIIRDSVDGYLVDHFDTEAFAKKVVEILKPVSYTHLRAHETVLGTYGSISDRDGIIRIRFAKHDFEHLWCKFTWLYNNCF